jgi:ribosomal-protein-alanine N-acetyltransferase
MIKSHKEKKEVENEIVDEIICNCCAKPIKKYDYGVFNDHIHINKAFGYWSNHDTEIHSMDICEDCYEKFIATFKIKPEITEYM